MDKFYGHHIAQMEESDACKGTDVKFAGRTIDLETDGRMR